MFVENAVKYMKDHTTFRVGYLGSVNDTMVVKEISLLFDVHFCTTCFTYRNDGKDSLKFYTEPGYFFELWCQAVQKDAVRSQQKRQRKLRRPPVSDTSLPASRYSLT